MSSHCPLCSGSLRQVRARVDEYRYVQCRECTLMTSLPRPSQRELREFYRNFTYRMPNDEDLSDERDLVSQDVGKITCGIEKYVEPLVGRRLLDLGGGIGLHAAEFAARGFDVSLVDVDPTACEFARQFDGVDVYSADVASLPFNGEMDVVFCSHVLEHHPDPKELLAAARRYLKRNGLLVLAVPNQESLEYLVRPVWFWANLRNAKHSQLLDLISKLRDFVNAPWLSCDPPRHLHSFNRRSLSSALQMTGFRVEDVFTEYSTSQCHARRKYRAEAIGQPKDIPRQGYRALVRMGIGVIRLLDRKNRWGNNLVAYARRGD